MRICMRHCAILIMCYLYYMMIDREYIKCPRLYVEDDLTSGTEIRLEDMHTHYLKNVLRKKSGDMLRLFNGRQGEWIGEIKDIAKKNSTAVLNECLKEQIEREHRLHLLFAPIKKARMDMLIEKSVELGVTDIHPVITQNTENRRLNYNRLQAQVIEASEQCERLNIPRIHDETTLKKLLAEWHEPQTLFVALERSPHTMHLTTASDHAFILIGPEGGFTEEEHEAMLAHHAVTAISLGEHILRAETAALKALSLLA